MPRAKIYEFDRFSVIRSIEPGYLGRYEVVEHIKGENKLLLVTTNEKEAISKANGSSMHPHHLHQLVTKKPPTVAAPSLLHWNRRQPATDISSLSQFSAQKRYQVKPTNKQTNGLQAENVASIAEFDTIDEYSKFTSEAFLPEGCDRWTIWDTHLKRWAMELAGKKELPLYQRPFN